MESFDFSSVKNGDVVFICNLFGIVMEVIFEEKLEDCVRFINSRGDTIHMKQSSSGLWMFHNLSGYSYMSKSGSEGSYYVQGLYCDTKEEYEKYVEMYRSGILPEF